MGNQPTTGGSGPVTLSPVSSPSSSSTSGDGLSTQLIIWGMVGFILVEIIGILCLLRYCCNARSRRKKANELAIKSIKSLSKSRENLQTNLSNIDALDHGQSIINELPLQTSAGGSKKRTNQISNEFESLYEIDETKFSGTASFAGSRDGRLKGNEPIETLEMLIDSGNKRISRKLISGDSGQDDDEEIIYKLSQRSNDDEVTYEYTGVLNPPYMTSYVNHAEIRPATPVRFEEARDLKKRSGGDSNTNSINRNIRFADDDSLRVSSRRAQRSRSYNRYDDDEDARIRRNKALSYEIHDGEPVKWQVARDLITPDWDTLKANADDTRGFKHANIIEPVKDENTRDRYSYEERIITHETFRSSKKDDRRNAPAPVGRQSPISFISNHEDTRVGHEAKPAKKGLYSQLPFGSMKRFNVFQNPPQPPPPIPINTESNAYKLVEEEKHTIKKILKDPDTDEILSVKSFIDFTNTIDVVPESELIRKTKNDDKFSIRTVSAATTTTTTNQIFYEPRKASAISNNTESNISVIDVNPKVKRESNEFERKSLSNQNSDSSLISERFPSPPEFGDDNFELKEKTNNNNNISRPRTPTSRNSFAAYNNNDIQSTINDEIRKAKDFSEITFKDKSLDFISINENKFDSIPEPATNKQRSTNVSIKSTASSFANAKPGKTLPATNILDEIRSFKPDTLKHTQEKPDMRVEYNLTPRSNSSTKKSDLEPPGVPPPPPPPPPPPASFVPPLGIDQQNSPRILTSVTLPNPSGLPDNPPTDRGDWSAVMKTFDENISGFTPKSLNNSLANLRAEIEEQENENIEAQLF